MNKFPTNDWLKVKVIKDSTEGLLVEVILYDKEKVIIKLSTNTSNEYMISQLLEKLPYEQPNLPKIYGVLTCYEKKEHIKQNLNSLINKGLCNGNNGNNDDIKIYMTIIENIKDSITLEQVGNSNFITNQYISLILQGLYQIYNLYYIFGIMHNDFNEGNILIVKTDKKEIKHKVVFHPYRYYDYEIIDKECNEWSKSKYITSHGLRMYLIDFDQGSCYHKKYINVKSINDHPISDVRKYVKAISKYADPKWWKLFEEHYNDRGQHLIKYSRQFFDKYRENPTEHNNYFLIDRTTVTLRMFCNELFKKYRNVGLTIDFDFC